MIRRSLALVLGVAVPTVLLGIGWLASTLREREALRREQTQMLARTADIVRGAVDESLVELRSREDRRPFYLYHPIYSPPDVIALNDPLATSPLARAPEDSRILGYFQLEPSGEVRTPYSPSPEEPDADERARRVIEIASSDAFEPLRALSFAPDSMSNPDQMSPLLASDPATAEALASLAGGFGRDVGAEAEGPDRRQIARTHAARQSSPGDASVKRQPGTAKNATTVRWAPPPPNDEQQPRGPLTTNLSDWNIQAYEELQQARGGDVLANERLQQRGRTIPRTRRNTVEWEQIGTRQPPVDNRGPDTRVRAMSQAGRAVMRPEAEEDAVGTPANNRGALVTDLHLPQQEEVEVDYTSMAWRPIDSETVVLHRVVSHEATTVVQGVILDRRYMVEQWIPSIVARHGLAKATPLVIERGDDVDCEIRRPASELLEGVELCYPPAAVAAATALGDDDVVLQSAALIGLMVIVTLAGLAMHRATRRAEELSSQKSSFISSVSHELRTPLTTIRMHAEMLRDGLVPETKRDKFHRQLVHESVRLSHLVENVLELSRLEEGRRVLRPQLSNLTEHVTNVLEEQRPFVEEKGFTLVGPRSDGEVHVIFDAQAVSQIVINLIDNAVKYGKGETNRVEVEVVREQDLAALIVRDRGTGIPRNQREQVFDRFHRIRHPEKEHMPGTGIGLSLVRDLARAHRGDAEVRDTPDGGCEVRVLFPLEPVGRASRA